MQVVRIINTWFATDGFGTARALFEAGRRYPLDAATQRQVDLGNGVIEDDGEQPIAAQPEAVAVEAPSAEAAAEPAAPAPKPLAKAGRRKAGDA